MTLQARLRLVLVSVLILVGSMALSQSAAGSTIRAVTVGERIDSPPPAVDYLPLVINIDVVTPDVREGCA